MPSFAFDAFIVSALFQRSGRAAFALGDGTVRFETGETVEAHPDAAVQSATLHPTGDGLITGGDDGRLVWSRAGEAPVELANVGSRWIDAVAASPDSGLVAFAAGKEAVVLDPADPKFRRVFAHERSVADVAFDAKGRRLACATYGGAAVWFARIEGQKSTFLKWAGSHVAVAWSPDGKFVISAMQENALHGWRLSDAKNMRMGGYPAKPRSIAFLADGRLMATSGAQGAVAWAFRGNNGPMGEQASEVGPLEEGVMVTKVAGAPGRTLLAAGRADGRVWVAELAGSRLEYVRSGAGAPISALATTTDGGRIAWGDEDGAAAVETSPV